MSKENKETPASDENCELIENIVPVKFFAIGSSENKTYGQGDFGKEVHICQKNAYMGEFDFHPVFKTKQQAEKYIAGLKFGCVLQIVELFVSNVNE